MLVKLTPGGADDCHSIQTHPRSELFWLTVNVPLCLSATCLHQFVDWEIFSLFTLSVLRCWLHCLLSVCLWASELVFQSFSFFSCQTETILLLTLEGLDNLMSVKTFTQCLARCQYSVDTCSDYYNQTLIWLHFHELSVFSYLLSDLHHPAILGGRSYCDFLT